MTSPGARVLSCRIACVTSPSSFRHTTSPVESATVMSNVTSRPRRYRSSGAAVSFFTRILIGTGAPAAIDVGTSRLTTAPSWAKGTPARASTWAANVSTGSESLESLQPAARSGSSNTARKKTAGRVMDPTRGARIVLFFLLRRYDAAQLLLDRRQRAHDEIARAAA